MDVEDVDAALGPVALPPPLGASEAVANNAEMADFMGAAAAESTTAATEADDEEIISTTTTMTATAAANAKSLTWKSIVDGTRVIHLTSSPDGRLGLTLVEISNETTGMPCGLQIVAVDPRYCAFRDKVSVGDVVVEIDGREVTTLADATKTKTSSTAGNEGRERSIIICKREYYLKDHE